MSATGIGAAVRRKEDIRFITGKGQYTDDVSRPGETRAIFVRSPHPRAKIKSIDAAAAKKMPGVVAVLTGAELAADKVGNLICGWMITSKDGSPMKMAPHPALAADTVNYVGDAVAVVIAETLAQARDAAEKVKIDYQVLPSVTDTAKAKAGPQIHEVAPKNTIYEWSLGDAKATDAAFAAAKHVTKLDIVNNRLVPNAIEPRVALAEYDTGNDSLTLWNTSQNPHVARLVISAFVGVAPEHKLRVIAPDVGGGFGSKIFIYPEEVVCLWAARKTRRLVPTRGHGNVDLRRSFRHALKSEGDFFRLARRARAIEAPRLVVLYDTSGSMDSYTRMLLAFAFALRRTIKTVEIFAFNTALVRVTRMISPTEIERTLKRLAESVPDWSGGTRIGACLAEFNARFLDALVNQRTTVVVFSDGLDHGDGAALGSAMRALRERAARVIWLNPLLGDTRYRPEADGMRAALPYVDHFGPAHNLESLETLLRVVR